MREVDSRGAETYEKRMRKPYVDLPDTARVRSAMEGVVRGDLFQMQRAAELLTLTHQRMIDRQAIACFFSSLMEEEETAKDHEALVQDISLQANLGEQTEDEQCTDDEAGKKSESSGGEVHQDDPADKGLADYDTGEEEENEGRE